MNNLERFHQCLLHPDVQKTLDSSGDPTLAEVMKRAVADESGDFAAAMLTLATVYVAATHELGAFLVSVAVVASITDEIPTLVDDDAAKEATP